METPKAIIEERQHALAGPDGAPASQRELAALTERYKGGPLASSTISRWASKMPGKAKEHQLELFSRATATPGMPWERIYQRLQAAFGNTVDVDSEPWIPPAEVALLSAEQKRWLTETVRMLVRTNRRVTLDERNAAADGDGQGATPPAPGLQ